MKSVIFDEGVAGILPGFGAFEVSFTRIFLWYAYRIKVEDIFVRIIRITGKPEDGFISSGEPV